MLFMDICGVKIFVFIALKIQVVVKRYFNVDGVQYKKKNICIHRVYI